MLPWPLRILHGRGIPLVIECLPEYALYRLTCVRPRPIMRVETMKHPTSRGSRKASTDSNRLAGPALEAFVQIAGHWDLTTAEQRTLLGSIPESTYFKYLKSPSDAHLAPDTLERISHILGIFKSLNILLPMHESADTWIRRPNNAALFKGRTALDYMLSGRFEDLVSVRHYLDSVRGW